MLLFNAFPKFVFTCRVQGYRFLDTTQGELNLFNIKKAAVLQRLFCFCFSSMGFGNFHGFKFVVASYGNDVQTIFIIC